MRIALPSKVGTPTEVVKQLGRDGVVVGTSKGYILFYELGNGEWGLGDEGVHRPAKGSIRRLAFLSPEYLIIAYSSGKLRLLQVSTGNVTLLASAKSIGVTSALAVHGGNTSEDPTIFVGNDEGDVHICKLSIEKSILTVEVSFDHHDDFIGSILHVAAKKTLLVGSGDGTLSIIDLKKMKHVATSKNYEHDLTALVCLSSSWKVYLSLGSGEVKAVNWHYWGAPSASLKGSHHDRTMINDLVLIEKGGERPYLLSACAEGKLRLFPALPLSDPAVEIFKCNDSLERLVWLPSSKCDSDNGSFGTVVAIPVAEAAFYSIPLNATHLATVSSVERRKKEESSDSDQSDESSANESDNDNIGGGTPSKKLKKNTAGAVKSGSAFFADLD